MKLSGRDKELHLLDQLLNSKKPEFLAIYGRRRIGKTFLIREFFASKKAIFFNTTGIKNEALSIQIDKFTEQVGEAFYQGAKLQPGKNWNKAFKMLTDATKLVPQNKKIVFFFDELPWMATKNSKLLHNLDYYWNQHWSKDPRIKLIICGSSAQWIIEKIVNNKGGLHNRITETIYLEPFTLNETKQFLRQSGVTLNNKQISQLYMVTGGVAHYLSKVEKGLSAIQNIEKLAFSKKSFLFDEFDKLFSSLFDDYESCIEILRVIANHRYGIGQEELFQKINKISKGIGGLSKLKSLEEAGFIISFTPHLHKKRGIYYKVIDEYTLFYFYWIEPIKKTLLQKALKKGYWEQTQATPAWRSWSGYAFESICYKHLSQISNALGIGPTAIPNAWRYAPLKGAKEQGAQIDLLFDRNDNAITICEIKYTDQAFVIDKEYARKLKNKIDIFGRITRTDKQIFLAMVASSGIKTTLYAEGLVESVVTLDDLFAKE